jgi:hypothetical protein
LPFKCNLQRYSKVQSVELPLMAVPRLVPVHIEVGAAAQAASS